MGQFRALDLTHDSRCRALRSVSFRAGMCDEAEVAMLTASETDARLSARRGNHALDRDHYCDEAFTAVIWNSYTTASGCSPCRPANWPTTKIMLRCRWAMTRC